MSTTGPLLPPTFLFRFAAPCFYRESLWSDKGIELEPSYRLPTFGRLEEEQREFAEIAAAWNAGGLTFTVRVAGKKQPPWCRTTHPMESDGLHLLIDTRDTHNVHRASRFCHHFVFLPQGSGMRLDLPWAVMLDVARARENARPAPPGLIRCHSEKRVDGYLLQAHIPAKAMVGFEPGDHPRLGFSYVIIDRELGWQTFGTGPPFPLFEDPSLWGTLELTHR